MSRKSDGGLLAGMNVCATDDKPCAAPGLISYRYRGQYGFTMIGASDDQDALRSAKRSMSYGEPNPALLERWDGARYVPVQGLVA